MLLLKRTLPSLNIPGNVKNLAIKVAECIAISNLPCVSTLSIASDAIVSIL